MLKLNKNLIPDAFPPFPEIKFEPKSLIYPLLSRAIHKKQGKKRKHSKFLNNETFIHPIRLYLHYF